MIEILFMAKRSASVLEKWHPRGADGAQIALAKSLCGALHRLPAKGVPGPPHCIQRIILAPHSERLLRVLRTLEDTSGARERRTGMQSDSISDLGKVVELPQVVGCIIATSEEPRETSSFRIAILITTK